jgi:hypothetical protein
MLGWTKETTVGLRIASRLLIFRTLGNKTRSKFVSSSENFYLGQEKRDAIDGLGDSGFNFRPAEDGSLEVVSTVDVKANLRSVSDLDI